MAQSKVIRSDNWTLVCAERPVIQHTIAIYRDFVRLLIGVVYSNWKAIAPLDEQGKQGFIEKLIHSTSKNQAKYLIFDKRFYKFPSYYRRAAITAAIGQVSSFVTRYAQWQSGIRKRRDARPPRLNAVTYINPVLYSRDCIRYHEDFVELKVFKDNDWKWINLPIKKRGKRHLNHKQLSPSLLLKGTRVHLSVPFHIQVKKTQQSDQIASFDLGINTGAVGSIVHPNGTVTARVFLHRAEDIDRRDRRLKLISSKARKSMGASGKLTKDFCRGLYRKAMNINREIAQRLANDIASFALTHEVSIIVFEHLKGFRPRGGRKRSTLRQRFHGWLHRRTVELVTSKMEELGKRVSYVNPRGTSKYAFDGSGLVKRKKENHSLAVFANGKRYNSDLSASYNIGARYWLPLGLPKGNSRAKLMAKRCAEAHEPRAGKSPARGPRMPVTLSDLWFARSNLHV